MIILSGQNLENEHVLIVDTKGNLDFGDEEVLSFRLKEPKEKFGLRIINDSLMNQHIDVRYFHRGKFFDTEVMVKPLPLWNEDYDDSLEIAFQTYEHRIGNLDLNRKKYEIAVYNSYFFSPTDNNEANQSINILKTPEREEINSLKYNVSTYLIGDVIFFDSLVYKIESVSPLFDTLTLKLVEKRDFFIAPSENKYNGDLVDHYLNDDTFVGADFYGKYTLIYFWGTQFRPSVELLFPIKALYEKYDLDDFSVIGVSFDQFPTNPMVMAFYNKLNWRQLYESMRKFNSPESYTKKLDINYLPVFLLIDYEGKIIARGSIYEDLKAIERYLDARLRH
ncbi:MAG: TlpA disulfide reductase family protein [Bacteroidota bacterium]